MTDTTNTTTQTAAAAPAKPKTVIEHFPSRSVFQNAEEASAFLNRQGETLSDFGEQTFAMAGVDDEGNFDPEIYGDGMRVMVAKLMNQGEKDSSGKRAPSTVKAIVVAPVPTLDSLLSDDAGKAWVQKILDKELNHVAVRALRDADDVASVIGDMPTTREAYISSQRDSGGIMEAFNALYKSINASLATKVKAWDRARLIKSELKKAMESTAYALDAYPVLEDRGEKESLFVTAIKIGQSAAKRAGMDPAIFDKWLATRDQAKAIPQTEDDEDEDIDIDALAAEIKTDEPAATQPTEPTGEQQEQEQPQGDSGTGEQPQG